ncbi:hypothetical protein [Komagataeibacter xylinus]|uniref:hypothetical protein n=1 Tax=Komagataeibacter xylinus TaxID=28448 RepID=UPI00280B5CA4|nr:hypothetical protein [Komagataeibacter xylinus]
MKNLAILGSGMVMLALGGCQSHPQIVHDKYTGTTACVSGKHTDHPGLLQTLNTIATYVRDKGYAVGIEYNSYNRLSPETVWSDGHQYTYNDLGSDAHACMGAGGCLIDERGAIKLSKDEFFQFAKTGFDFKIVGYHGAVTGHMPASTFQSVIDQCPDAGSASGG